MPQPKWYHKSLSELCMDNIVENMEKWTALRNSEHVSCYFYRLPSHCLEYMTLEWVERNRRITKEMFELLLNPHWKVLDLSNSNITEVLRIVRLASVCCSQLKLQLRSIRFFSITRHQIK